MRRFRTPLTLAAGAVAALTLAACAPSGEPDEAAPSPSGPDVSSPSSPAPEPAEGVAAGFEIPACEEQIDVLAMRYVLGPDVAFIADISDTWQPVGPAATDALASADAATACLWGVPNSGRGVSVAVVELGPSARDDLIAALQDAGTFSVEQFAGAQVFTADGIESGDVTTAAAYVFHGAAWVSVSGGELIDAAGARDLALTVRSSLDP